MLFANTDPTLIQECETERPTNVAGTSGHLTIAGRLVVLSLSVLLASIFLSRSADAQPIIRYLTPDAAAPGMTVAVEIIGDYTQHAAFGADGLYFNTVRLVDPADTQQVIVGPQVVSWDGRAIQFMLFVRPEAQIGTVAITVQGGANSATFNIVDPLDLGVLTGNVTIVAGQSRRNTIVVDSLVLSNGTFRFPVTDIDPATPGNQAYLPTRVLSLGPIRLTNAQIEIAGSDAATNTKGGNGGPGGGGGGGGMPGNGGDGYTGGGGVGEQSNHNLRHGGEGTDGGGAHYYDGGSGLSGAPGGEGTEHSNPLEGNDEGGGGGTGHPFGKGGSRGVYKLDSQPGGFGGGSGGGTSTSSGTTNYGGGGGGFATPGAAGEGTGDNGGRVHGNEMLVPFAAGSGGGAGNVAFGLLGVGGSGGGGGGAIEFASFRTFEFRSGSIDVNGGNGSPGVTGFGENGAGGGGGSGGAVIASARDSLVLGSASAAPVMNVAGGAGANGYRKGGDGGQGRVRLDGFLSSTTGDTQPAKYFTTGRDYNGPAIRKVVVGASDFTVYGTSGSFGASVNPIHLYYAFPSDRSTWTPVSVTPTVVSGSNTPTWTAGPFSRPVSSLDDEIYIVALEDNVTPVTGTYADRPREVMTHVSGYLAKIAKAPISSLDIDTLDFGLVRVGECKDSFVTISNTGDAALDITSESIADPRFSVLDGLPVTVAPGTSKPLRIRFCPGDTSRTVSTDRIESNAAQSPQIVTLIGKGKQGRLQLDAELDFGLVRVGECKDSSITAINTGDDTLAITFEAIGDPRFTSLDALPIILGPGASRTLLVRFCPSDSNAIVSADTVGNDASTLKQTVRLLGKGKKSILSIPATLDFGNVVKGTCKDTGMYVHNLGNDSLIITSESLSNPKFVALSPSLPVSIAAYDSTFFSFRYCSSDTGSERSDGTITAGENGSFVLTAHTSAGSLDVDSLIDLGCVITDSATVGTFYMRNFGNDVVHITGLYYDASLRMLQGPAGDVTPGGVDSVTIEVTANSPGPFSDSIDLVWLSGTDVTRKHSKIYIIGHVSNPPKLEMLRAAAIDFDTVDLGVSRGDSCIEVTNYSCKAIDSAQVLIEGSAAFQLRSSATANSLVDSSRWTYCFAFAPNRSGADSATVRFVNGSDTSAAVLLRGVGRGQDIPVVLSLDTLYAVPGNVVPMRVRIVNDVTAAGITSVTFRVKYDLMQLDLKQPRAVSGYATNATVTDVAHAIDDHEITVTSASPLVGSGVIAELPFEVLLPTMSVTDVAVTSASFGGASASLSAANPGRINIVQCDTTDRIVFVPKAISVQQNTPNPFNPRTTVRVDVHTAGHLVLRVLNTLGQEVARPYDAAIAVGPHSLQIDAGELPSGVYQYRVEWSDNGRTVETVRKWMTVVR